jgi:hypothetical protein
MSPHLYNQLYAADVQATCCNICRNKHAKLAAAESCQCGLPLCLGNITMQSPAGIAEQEEQRAVLALSCGVTLLFSQVVVVHRQSIHDPQHQQQTDRHATHRPLPP